MLHVENYFPALTQGGNRQMKMCIRSPTGGSDSMRLMYLNAITAAERSIDIEAAYSIPDPPMLRERVVAQVSVACVFKCYCPVGIST